MPPPDKFGSTFSPISESLKVDLFFDATLSMQGFTRARSSSFYQQSVPLLERAVIEGWSGGEASFFKFGDQTAPLPGRTFLDATKPEFYSDTKYNKKTFIERVIDRAAPDHLTIIVTDLFQDNADVNQLSAKLKDKFIAAGLAIGVLGIRSQFDGTVYDVGPNNYSFAYKSSDKPQTGRPFYLLAFGSHANIAHYFATLERSGLSNFPERHGLILSRFITAHQTPFASAKLRKASQISEISSANLVAQTNRHEQIRAFKISKKKKEGVFSTSWSYESLPNVLEHSADLIAETTGSKGEEAGTNQLRVVESESAKAALEVTAKLQPEGGPYTNLEFQGNLNVQQLPMAGIYCYRIILRPKNYSLPAWVSDWSMRDGELEAWHSKAADFNGAKTYNLQNFLSTLKGAIENNTPPEAGEFYVYLRVD